MARVALHEYSDAALDLVESGAVDQAIAICRHILKRYPQHIPTYEALAHACLARGEYGDAQDLYKRILAADPENMHAYAGISITSERLGQVQEAAWYMERALELAPGNEEIRAAMRRLYGKVHGVEPPRLKLTKLALARMYAKGGQFRQAISEMMQLLEVEPQRIDIKVSLAETLWLDGRLEQAAELACEILEDSPVCLKATLLLAMVEKARGRTAEAEEILTRVRSIDPDYRISYAFFGDASPVAPQTVRLSTVESASEPEAAEPQADEGDADVPALATVAEATEVAELAEAAPDDVVPSEHPAASETPDSAPEPLTIETVAGEPDSLPVIDEVSFTDATLVAATLPEHLAAPQDVSPPGEEDVISTTLAEAPALAAEEMSDAELEAPEEAPAAEQALAAPGTRSPDLQVEIERYKLQVEQHPKDNEARLGLARAYTAQEQIKAALEQYRLLAKAKGEVLAHAIQDVETIVASRPDNLEAHELLADLYTQDGQLARAVERYRWILQRLAKP